jgi:ATP-dependent DNA helicase RecG
MLASWKSNGSNSRLAGIPDPILRTLCAFANDFENLGGGYLVIGQDCKNGQAVFPPVGVPHEQLDRIQRELLQYCHLIHPPYFPNLSIEEFQGKTLVVLWAPGGQTRPYKVPKSVTGKEKDYRHYIRRYANTVEAKNGELRELFSLAATVPFDDRICHRAELDDLQLPLIRSFLKDIKSGLYSPSGKLPLAELGRSMNIVEGSDEFLKPRNVGLMFFNDSPETFFPTTQIDVVLFPEGVAGNKLEEKIFRGPLHHQLRDALMYLRNMVVEEHVTKVAGRAEAERVFNYPYEAIEEALVNAVYHRSYEIREPIEVRVNPDRIEILSYPGPDPSISLKDLNAKRYVTRRYRNRRIGEFLKELELTEGRGTGIPAMRKALRANGSLPPRFKTDRNRTSFLVELLIHPAFLPSHTRPEVSVEVPVEVPVELNETERVILALCRNSPQSKSAIIAGLGYDKMTGNVWKALQRLTELKLIELTIPAKPNSKNQKRRITPKGLHALASDS